jgi:hypothetical protein
MLDFMSSFGIEHEDAVELPDGRVKWTLPGGCPFNQEHAHKDSAIFLTNGMPGFKCFHNSCATNDWKTLRAKLETEQDKQFHFFHVNAAQSASADVVTQDEMVTERASDIKPEVITWLWTNRVAIGKLTLFVGHPGIGKGLATMDVAARVSTGKDWPDCKSTVPPSQCLVVSSEDSAGDTLVPRLMAAQADLDRVFIQRIIKKKDGGESTFSLATDMNALQRKLEQYPGIRLVVIDPLFNHLGSLKGNSEQDMRQALTPLGALAEQFKVAIIIVSHFNKNKDQDKIQRTGGAQAVGGCVRMAWMFAAEQNEDGSEGQRSMIALKANIANSNATGLKYDTKEVKLQIDGATVGMACTVWGKATHKSAASALGSESGNAAPTKTAAAKEWLKEFLKPGQPLEVSLIKSAALIVGFTSSTIDRASNGCVIKTQPANPGPHYWEVNSALVVTEVDCDAD